MNQTEDQAYERVWLAKRSYLANSPSLKYLKYLRYCILEWLTEIDVKINQLELRDENRNTMG